MDRMNDIKTLIFDLGNVVIRHDDELLVDKIAERSSGSAEEVNEALDRARNPFQRGEEDPREYFEAVSESIGDFDGGYEEFKQVICSHFSRNEEMEELVQKVAKSRYNMALLSNTNVVHYEFIEKNFPVVELFDSVVLSFREGARKPEKEIFEIALDKTSSQPEESVFIDNKEKNARAAAEAGIKGVHFVGRDELVEDLEDLGVDIEVSS